MLKKAWRIILWIIFFILIAAIVFLLLPLNTTTMNSHNTLLEVPQLLMIRDDNDHTFSAKSIRSTVALKKDMDKIITKLEKITCNNHDYYYDRTNDYTIIEYGIVKQFILNNLWIDYAVGNYCLNLKT